MMAINSVDLMNCGHDMSRDVGWCRRLEGD